MLKTIKLNKLMNIIVAPGWLDPNKVLNSLCRVNKVLFHNSDHREGIAQNIIGRKRIPRKVESQLSGNDKMLEVGSNTENRLVIIFSLFLVLWVLVVSFLFWLEL